MRGSLSHCIFLSIAAHLYFFSLAAAEEPGQKNLNDQKQERIVETTHSLKIQGKELRYKAAAGQIHLKDSEGKVKATFFYVGYTKDGVKDHSQRPLTFCFNGGPGSSSVWLHMGLLGPVRVAMDEEGSPLRPYRLTENEYTLLDHTDLIFIDPISTGYSRQAHGEDPKQFHSYDEDIKSVGEFIRLYTTRNDRWLSPKFIIGESYGTTRAAGLVLHLHEAYNMYFDGLVLVSTALNYQTFRFHEGNDLPYITFLPGYAATAWYHHKIPRSEYPNLEQLLKDSEDFAYGAYASALMKGDKISNEERQDIVRKLSFFTGLSEQYIKNSHFRVPTHRFTKELLRDSERTVGRFDSRYTGIAYDPPADRMEYDPSAELVFGAFTSVFNHYILSDLNWTDDQEYKILTNVFPWDWGKAKGYYVNVATDLREAMSRNPHLKVMIANGYYDLATPYFAAEYTLDHIDLDPAIRDNIRIILYDAGHMMYTHKPSLIRMKRDLSKFYHETLAH